MQETENSQEYEKEENNPVKFKDRSFNFLMAQTVICALAVAFVLVLKALGGYYYSYSKAVFEENFNKPINVSQVLSAEETREILTAQSTVYGAGGTEEEVKFLIEKSQK